MKEEQIKEFQEILERYIKKDKINHAYLLETNSSYRMELAEELVKKILWDETGEKTEEKLNDLIKNGDLQTLTTENQVIKKEKILDLKEKFKTKSIYNSKRIYIIEEAEKLNNASANTLLKFLEEPEDDIEAILVTSNRNIVINTIVSRCQIIRYHSQYTETNEEEEYNKNLISFIENIETRKEKAIAYINQYNIKALTDRKYLSDFLKNMLTIYDEVLRKKAGQPIERYQNYEEKIEKIEQNNTIETIKNKIEAINTCINRMKYNPNAKLLLDKLVILMTGVDCDV